MRLHNILLCLTHVLCASTVVVSSAHLPASFLSSSALRGGSSSPPTVENLQQQQQHQATVETSLQEQQTDVVSHDTNATKGAALLKSILQIVFTFGFGGFAAIASYQFSLHFPSLLTPEAAKATYIPASFSYNLPDSIFCDSAWTYLTDYGLGAVMMYLANKIRVSATNDDDDNNNAVAMHLKHLGFALMTMYAIQFTVAGVLHQFMGSFESRNTAMFRVLWTVVVTMVSASGGVIGAFASKLAKEALNVSQQYVPNDWFWAGYIIIITAITVSGRISYQRPAADTFVAGTSQAGSTFFLIGVVALMGRTKNPRTGNAKNEFSVLDQARCILGFLLNSFLLPGYALALYHTKVSVAQLNTTMHSWLCLCYTLQGLSLSKIVRIFGERSKEATDSNSEGVGLSTETGAHIVQN